MESVYDASIEHTTNFFKFGALQVGTKSSLMHFSSLNMMLWPNLSHKHYYIIRFILHNPAPRERKTFLWNGSVLSFDSNRFIGNNCKGN
jgi:hypothetical protein